MSASITGIGRGLFRLVFRGGSPERIRYSDHLLIGGILGALLTTVLSQLWFFESSLLETGLALLTIFPGIYLGAALAGRRLTRSRLRVGVQSGWLLQCAVQLLLVVLSPLARLSPDLRHGATVAAAIILFLGTMNVIRFWRGRSWSAAAMTAAVFFACLIAFYTTLSALLAILFA